MPPPSDDPVLDALFAAAREPRPDTSRAEYGFETRLLARLSHSKAERDGWEEFAAWCWRLVPAFAVITLAAGLWTLRTAPPVDESLLAAAIQQTPADDDERVAQWLAFGWLTPI